ncbi:MAG TPA: ABC transporter ATP-binding protein, partial [Azospirillaceae bacterium]|nr:ABC transporter ATP-binding protein [Azospirillaceae bacterium]
FANARDLGSLGVLVPQDPEVFESSIRQNITMGIDYDPAAVERACELACLAPVIARLPDGIDTAITERGLNLSGGQKQRLALARGMLAARAASVIMLDEPTSSVDPKTEGRLYDHLLGEFPDACVVSSLHRLHLLARFDTVVLMAEGRIVDKGPREAMLARHPHLRAGSMALAAG